MRPHRINQCSSDATTRPSGSIENQSPIPNCDKIDALTFGVLKYLFSTIAGNELYQWMISVWILAKCSKCDRLVCFFATAIPLLIIFHDCFLLLLVSKVQIMSSECTTGKNHGRTLFQYDQNNNLPNREIK